MYTDGKVRDDIRPKPWNIGKILKGWKGKMGNQKRGRLPTNEYAPHARHCWVPHGSYLAHCLLTTALQIRSCYALLLTKEASEILGTQDKTWTQEAFTTDARSSKQRKKSGKHRALPIETVGILTWNKLDVYLMHLIMRNGHSPGTSVTKSPQCLPSHIFPADWRHI